MLLAAAICYLVTPYVETYALRFGAIARVRTRDIHTETTPRWGGVSMWFATSFTFAVVSHLPLVGKSFGREAQGIFLAATFVVLLGMIDDRYELDALTKLAGQTVAAGILLTFGVQLLWLPINGLITLPPSIGQFLTVMVILVAINAVNFIDGMDGLASGVVAVAATSFFIFAYVLAVVYGFSRAGAPSTFSAVLIGVCVGFLPHNAYPAKIFMGDSGSMFLGLMLGAAAITLTGQFDPNAISSESTGPTFLPLLLPFAVLAIPLVDFAMAVIRRVRAGRSPFAPDNEHLHHRLFRAGNSQIRTVIIMYLWTAAIAFPVTTWAFAPLWVAVLVGAVFGLGSILLTKRKSLELESRS
jgi:UDP-GlcNAc:undecaprenyl-phosphate GlcNAc-1-phosphate transferase